MFVALLLRLLTDDFGGMCVAIHGEQGEESRNLGEGEGNSLSRARCRAPPKTPREKEGERGYHTFVQNNWPISIVVEEEEE